MKIIIKPANIKNLNQLYNLNQTAYLDVNNVIPYSNELKYSIEDEKAIISEYSKQNNLYLVAWLDNQIVGFIQFTGSHYQKTKHTGKLELFVRTEFRSQKIGQQLIKELLIWTKKKKLKRIELEVWTNNKPAINLYQKLGFKIEGKRIKAYKLKSRYLDGILMAKDIS
ncbi:MAG TPA: GNAT family N-acetyltransferase [Patescibacteria group bacterium]|nr:GNAT family N-acetyltransferase [Patescibacteria group bacterium]